MMYRYRPEKRRGVSSEKSTNDNSNLNMTRPFCADSEESEFESDDSSATTALEPDERDAVRNERRRSYEDHRFPPPLLLSSLMRPIDLTTDHSAHNPVDVIVVLLQ